MKSARWVTVMASLTLTMLSSRAAHADDTSGARKVTVTWSPIHLVLPVVEVAAELSVAPNIGVGVIAGVGRVSDSTNTITATAFEAGGQFNYYFMRSFSGLHAGAELLYLHLGDVEQDTTATASGLSLGPYVGYKVLTSIGFTFVAQGGVAFAAYSASSSTQSQSERKIFPLLNLNVGWSF
jgi:hypothetical protein